MEKARELGAWLGQHRKWLVYGGSNTGLMEALARSAKENGAMIMGVVPTKLEEHGRVSDSEQDLRNELHHNLCRCGTHVEIMQAALRAVQLRAERAALQAPSGIPSSSAGGDQP